MVPPKMAFSLWRRAIAAIPIAVVVGHALIASTAGGAQAAPEDLTVQELQRELAERDIIIAELVARLDDLMRRFEELERQLRRTPALDQTTLPKVAPVPEPKPASSAPSAADGITAEAEPQRPAAPGQFEVDEEEIDRALERSLVQQGVLLLPFGKAEIEPSFSFTRREAEVPTFFVEDGTRFVALNRVRRNEFRTGLALRVGLPFDSQFTIAAPFRYVDQSRVTTVASRVRGETSATGSGFGDLRVDFAKTLAREQNWRPDVVAEISWDTDTAETRDNGVILGGGFHELGGSLRMVKRQDPLAFVGSVSYEKAFEANGVEPGDELGFALGAVLAASPATSLRLFFNVAFIEDAEVDGQVIRGSDDVIGTFTVGGSSIILPGGFLDIAATLGVTDRGLDFALITSLPIRFNLPVF